MAGVTTRRTMALDADAGEELDAADTAIDPLIRCPDRVGQERLAAEPGSRT